MTISVIIPTLNRPDRLRAALYALSKSTFPRSQIEVIVVDDGGSSDLQTVTSAFTEMKVIVIRQNNRGPASARNTGASAAAGRILAFTDDDCEPSPGWLDAIAATLTVEQNAMTAGPVVNGLPSNHYSESSQVVTDFCLAHYNPDPANARFFPSYNFAVPAELYRSVGGFNGEFRVCGGEDREFCDRWISLGLKLVWTGGALVTHRHEMNFRGFWSQHFRYGRGAYRFALAKRQRYTGGVRFEGLGFHLGIIGAPFRMAPPVRALFLAFLVFVSQMAVAAGYAREMIRQRIGMK